MLHLPSSDLITDRPITQDYWVFFTLLVELLNSRLLDTGVKYPVLNNDQSGKIDVTADGVMFVNGDKKTLNCVLSGKIFGVELKEVSDGNI